MNPAVREPQLPPNPFVAHNHISLRRVDGDHAEAVLLVAQDSVNPYGILHGGAYYTMADCAAAAACRSDGRRYVTLDGAIHFLRSAAPGDTVTAAAAIRHRGRTTALTEVTITDQNARLLATGEFTFFCIGPGELSPDT